MKRTFKILCAAMLALAVVGCENGPIEDGDNNLNGTPEDPTEQEPGAEDPIVGPNDFVLHATLPASRTILNSDNFSVSWEANDELAVFYCPTGTAEYSNNLLFNNDAEATGKFTPNSSITLADGVNYDWYVLLPRRVTSGKAELVTPKGESKEDGYFPIGAAEQNGYGSSTHISKNDIMVGKALNTRNPEIALKHLAVLHKFTVTNNSNVPIIISKLTFNSGDKPIFGTFWIDLTAEEPKLDPAKANGTFTERALTVQNGEELAIGASADFYIVTAPFTLNAGDTFKVKIDTNNGSQTLEKVAPATIEFAAGTYNTAKLEYNYEVEFADHLYYETFNTSMKVSQTTAFDVSQHTGSTLTSNNKGEFVPATITNYNGYKDGLSVYDGNTSAITYSCDGTNACLSKNVATAITHVTGTYVWFRKSTGGYIQVDGIKLHGHQNLVLSYVQNIGNGGAVSASYSVDGGANWTPFTTTNANGTHEFSFSLNEVAETISLRFTEAGSNNVRVDDIKLTWAEAE